MRAFLGLTLGLSAVDQRYLQTSSRISDEHIGLYFEYQLLIVFVKRFDCKALYNMINVVVPLIIVCPGPWAVTAVKLFDQLS